MANAVDKPTENLIPQVRGDQTIPLLLHGYSYLSERMRQLNSEGFEGRFLGKPTVFVSGPQAVRLFYDNERFERSGAVPSLVQLTLFGKHTVQALDGDDHRRRKAMFSDLTDASGVGDLVELFAHEWRRSVRSWQRRDRIRLFDESVNILGRAALRWVGLRSDGPRAAVHIHQMRLIVENFGARGVGQLRGRLARLRSNAWAADEITAVRQGRLTPDPGSMLSVIADHRDADGRLLDLRTAAEELLNVLRPIVAIAWWITFVAHALNKHPQWCQRLADADDATVRAFTDEVRRLYPFAPILAARARYGFNWKNHQFSIGQRVILDLYGTNHDSRQWPQPDRFDPRRFEGGAKGSHNFVPQGGGGTWSGHRCPGEDITSAIMDWVVRDLAALEYQVPRQDLRVNFRRFPTVVRSGFVISNVRSPQYTSTYP